MPFPDATEMPEKRLPPQARRDSDRRFLTVLFIVVAAILALVVVGSVNPHFFDFAPRG
ncbi:MAG: hypothetical protein KDJ77_18755 [Rhodobiaceae bacterium]|nr:hypothetical protein [Rhodobiaceae bacterium]